MLRSHVIVAFGDVIGFGNWIRRAALPEEIRRPLIESFYREMVAFVRDHKDVQIKYMGDGLMVLKELPDGPSCRGAAMKFLSDIIVLTATLRKTITEARFPRPGGFRMRIAASVVDKVEVLDPVDPERKRTIWEFVGYAINLAERLLYVSPEMSVICHESVVDLLGKQDEFVFNHMDSTQGRPKSVDDQDLEELWTIEMRRKKR